MARPKLGEGDTQRLQLKISDEELTAIDDWRFANRINSRSEAVRILIGIGIRESPNVRARAWERAVKIHGLKSLKKDDE